MSTSRAGHAKTADLGHGDVSMNQTIEEIERFLRHEDPNMVKRFEHLARVSAWRDAATVSLVMISVALLAIGIANLSFITYGVGTAVFIAAFLVDHVYERKLDES